MTNPSPLQLTESQIAGLVRRMDLLPQLVRRQQEELIVDQVPLPPQWLEQQRQEFLGDQSLVQVLETRGWSDQDLDLHLRRSEALRRFARQRFGPGWKKLFCLPMAAGSCDFFLRVRDAD